MPTDLPPPGPDLPAPDDARWQKAQRYEEAWWRAREDRINPSFYRHYADLVRASVAPFLSLGDATRTVEIGSGAAGIVTGLPGERVATDPLEGYYGTVPSFVAARDPAVRYIATPGERLPLEDAAFDLALCDNVLDHVARPEAVLAEVRRVLRPGGVFWLRVHVYHGWGRAVRRAAEALQLDAGHPHTFTAESLEALLAASGLRIAAREGDGFAGTWRREFVRGVRGSWKDLAKAVTFATRRHAVYVLVRP